MASSVFIWPGLFQYNGSTVTVSVPFLAPDGTNTAPSYSFSSDSDTGFYWGGNGTVVFAGNGTRPLQLSGATVLAADNTLNWTASNGNATAAPEVALGRDAANVLFIKNGTNAQGLRIYGYSSGSRLAYGTIQTVTTAVSVSGATTTTGNVIPAGATVLDVCTSTTTTITGATGYQVGDGTTATRWGDITGTAVGTSSGSTNYTADPRWWTAAARAITLTAKTSNFTGGVVQVIVTYTASAGA